MTSHKLVIAEKPSVAITIGKVLNARKRQDGYIEGNGYIISWCVGHLVAPAPPDAYDDNTDGGIFLIFPLFRLSGSTMY